MGGEREEETVNNHKKPPWRVKIVYVLYSLHSSATFEVVSFGGASFHAARLVLRREWGAGSRMEGQPSLLSTISSGLALCLRSASLYSLTNELVSRTEFSEAK